MAYHQLDDKGKPIPVKGRSRREPAMREERGKKLYHYEITASTKRSDGKMRQIRRRYWLPNDTEDHAEAQEKERELRRKAPAKALTWQDAYTKWIEGNKNKFSAGHINNSSTTIRQWVESFGAGSTIESTGLAEFSQWIDEHAKKGAGRGAQIKFGHLMAIARWCRKRGYITSFPFEHAPKPEARLNVRAPATPETFRTLLEKLPTHIALVWELLGLTGMRLGAACTLQESDIKESVFTVTTKGDKRVTYPLSPAIANVFRRAREWKVANKFFQAPTLFCNQAGNAWTSTTIGRYFKKASSGKNTPKATAHQLRHMAGTIMGKENFSRDIIQAALGHDDDASTGRYVSKDLEMRAKGIAAVASFLQENDAKTLTFDISICPSNTEEMSVIRSVKCPLCGHNIIVNIKIKPQP